MLFYLFGIRMYTMNILHVYVYNYNDLQRINLNTANLTAGLFWSSLSFRTVALRSKKIQMGDGRQ